LRTKRSRHSLSGGHHSPIQGPVRPYGGAPAHRSD